MYKLPIVSGDKVISFLKKNGFEIARQKGSHVFLKHKDGRSVTVPRHPELDRGTLKSILEQASISRREFIKGV